MRYSDRPRPTLSIPELVGHIAETATGGDSKAALADFLHAARDGAIEVFDDTGKIAPRELWGWEINVMLLGRLNFGPAFPIWRFFGRVRWADVERLWPRACEQAAQAAQVDNPYMPTGAPRRPTTGTHLVRGEFQRRFRENLCRPSLQQEAMELREWFCRFHPTAQPPTIRTIENNIRADYRAGVAGAYDAGLSNEVKPRN
jgi:hypothetical protein